MLKRVTLLALASMLTLALAGCSSEEPQQNTAARPAAAEQPKAAPKPAEENVPVYELTKDEVTTHKDWTSRNISILGAKIGDKTRDAEKKFGSVENTRTLPEDYLTVYQGNGLFVYTFKLTGKARKMEVNEIFAKQIADAKLKKLLQTGDLKYMRELFGQEEGVVENADDNATEYVYDSRGFRFVKFKVGKKTVNAIRFAEMKKATT